LFKISLYAVFARTARTVVAVTTIRARTTVTVAEATLRTVAIAARTVVTVALLHHGRRAFFMLFNSDRHVTQDVFADAHLAFHFLDRSGRRIDVHQGVMSLAVLLDAIGEGLEAPVFDTPDFTAVSFDDTLVLFYEGVDLLSGDILSSKEYMFIKSHG